MSVSQFSVLQCNGRQAELLTFVLPENGQLQEKQRQIHSTQRWLYT